VLFGSADKVKGICSQENRSDKWILCHDNVPAHEVLRVCEFLAKKSITKWTIHLISTLSIFGSFKIKKCPEGMEICWHS
jgi:hypothetical protein